MSTPDAKLNAAERAALADLEAAAAAADPGLAARLRGGVTWRVHPAFRLVRLRLLAAWTTLLRASWWGVPMTLVGLLLMVIGIGSGLELSLAGAVVSALGLRVLAEIVVVRLRRQHERSD